MFFGERSKFIEEIEIHRVDTIGNIFTSGTTRENITDGVHSMK